MSQEVQLANLQIELNNLRKEKDECQKIVAESLKNFQELLTETSENLTKKTRDLSGPVITKVLCVRINRDQENLKLLNHGILGCNKKDFELHGTNRSGRQLVIKLSRKEEELRIKKHLKRLD